MVDTYTAVATRPDTTAWLVSVPELGRNTQADSIAQVESAARELIAILLDAPADTFDVVVRIVLPDTVTESLKLANRYTAEALRLQNESAVARRAAARDLKARGLTVRDIGAALGVSHGRAQQLLTTSV